MEVTGAPNQPIWKVAFTVVRLNQV
jgi:hypothetical protein